jgi:hypothetical protein
MEQDRKTILAIAHIRAARECLADYLDPENAQNRDKLVDEIIGILDSSELVEVLGLEPLFEVRVREQ